MESILYETSRVGSRNDEARPRCVVSILERAAGMKER